LHLGQPAHRGEDNRNGHLGSQHEQYPSGDRFDLQRCDDLRVALRTSDQTPALFAMKGLLLVTSPWRKPDLAVKQTWDMFRFRQQAKAVLKDRTRAYIFVL